MRGHIVDLFAVSQMNFFYKNQESSYLFFKIIKINKTSLKMLIMLIKKIYRWFNSFLKIVISFYENSVYLFQIKFVNFLSQMHIKI